MTENIREGDFGINSAGGDDLALQLLHLSETEVDRQLQELAARNVQQSVHHVKNKLPIKKAAPLLSVVGKEKSGAHEFSKNPEFTGEKPQNWLQTWRDFLPSLWANPKTFYAFSAGVFVVSIATGLVFGVALSNLATDSAQTYADVTDNVFSVSGRSVSEQHLQNPNQINKVHIDFEQSLNPEILTEIIAALPVSHPVFASETMTIAVNECRQCHEDVFAGI